MGTSNPGDLLESAWSAVAAGYEAYWIPRFRPFIDDALARFRPGPEGVIAVPGCGPGEEVFRIADRYPDRSVLATDLSRRMIARVWARLREQPRPLVLATVGPADDLSSFVRGAAGVFSSFTLQLLPDPLAALADWRVAVRDVGTITALFWPAPDLADAFGRFRTILARRSGEASRPDWTAVVREKLPEIGLELVEETALEHEIVHDSPGELARGIVESGPLQVSLRRFGRECLDAVCEEWSRDPGLTERDGQWVHTGRALLWSLKPR